MLFLLFIKEVTFYFQNIKMRLLNFKYFLLILKVFPCLEPICLSDLLVHMCIIKILLQEEFEDSKGVIRIHKCKDRQHMYNGLPKKGQEDKQRSTFNSTLLVLRLNNMNPTKNWG